MYTQRHTGYILDHGHVRNISSTHRLALTTAQNESAKQETWFYLWILIYVQLELSLALPLNTIIETQTYRSTSLMGHYSVERHRQVVQSVSGIEIPQTDRGLCS